MTPMRTPTIAKYVFQTHLAPLIWLI
jgi:hypothetical protein